MSDDAGTTAQRWRGLAALVKDAVVHGASAVERVHMATAKRPFDVLEAIPVVELPTRAVHVVHDLATTSTYAAIRLVARAAGAAVDLAIVAADRASRAP